MSDTSSGNDWELVTGSLSSHESSAASSSSADGGGAGQGGMVDSNVGSGYFVCDPIGGESQHAELLSSGVTEEFTVTKTKPAVGEGEVQMQGQQSADLREEVAFLVGEVDSKKVEDIDYARGILMSDSCTTELHDLSKLDWMEPRPPGAGHQLLEYEGNELGSTSNPGAPEIKAGLEPDSQQVGPLLGSCMSAPSSPSIVSRDNSFRLHLSDEMIGEVLGGSVTSQRGIPMEVEQDTLASVDHEVLLAHSAFISPDSVAAMRKMGSESELGNERASETWWSKQCLHGRQASTYWSIALAAAVMGLVILGHRWQYERRQNQQLRLRLCAKEEKIGQLIVQLARMKEALSGRRRVPVLRSNSYLNDSFDRY